MSRLVKSAYFCLGLLGLFAVVLAGCVPAQPPAAALAAESTAASPTATRPPVIVTSTPAPTATPPPTETSFPTTVPTATSTATPIPTATPDRTIACSQRLPDDDLFTIVTLTYGLSRDYAPGDLVPLAGYLPRDVTLGYPTEVRRIMADPLVAMVTDMQAAGLEPRDHLRLPQLLRPGHRPAKVGRERAGSR